ncbi:MAG: hypothetical protein LUQ66_10065 [Methanoregula sp.]|nr:hypothetical protein [Methanoregula sp.]
MVKQNLLHGSVIAALFIAAVIGVSMVNGSSVEKPFISVDPVSDKNSGDAFTITGNTSLPAGSEILVDIHPSSLDLKTGMVTDPKTGTTVRMDDSMVATGMVGVKNDPDGIAAWSFDVPSKKFLAGEYTVIAYVYDKNAPAPGEISGTTTFTVHGSQAPTGQAQFIRVDPIGDKNVGDAFTITGTTNLPAGNEILFQVYAASFEPSATNPQQSGEFSGATGIVAVMQGTGDVNTWSADLDLATFPPREYLVNVSAFTGDVSRRDYSSGNPTGRLKFTVHPAAGNAGTSPQSDKAVAGGILIDPIYDTPSGKLLEVTGKTNLSVGTPLIVKVIPASMDNESVRLNYQNPENAAVIHVVKGDGVNNRFSVALDTSLLPLSDHIILVSDMADEAAGIQSEPAGWTGSALFNIIAGTAGTGTSQVNLSAPGIFINPFGDVTAGESVTVTGTTNVPAGSEFRVMVIPESSTDYEHPELAATVSAVKGSSSNNLFSATLATKDLPKGNHILIVSAEGYEATGSVLFTVE